MKSNLALATVVTLLGLSCSAPAANVPAPTVVVATATTVPPTPAPIASPTPIADLAQTRNGAALPVWISPAAAYVAQFDPQPRPGAEVGLQCTLPPFADVRVAQRDVGFAAYQLSDQAKSALRVLSNPPGGASDKVASVSSVDGRCTGYVLASLLT